MCKTTKRVQCAVWQRNAAVKEFVSGRRRGLGGGWRRGGGGASCETSTGGWEGVGVVVGGNGGEVVGVEVQ